MINIIKKWVCGTEQEDILLLKNQLRESDLSVERKDKKINICIRKRHELTQKILTLERKTNHDVMDSDYWNSKWKMSRVVYNYGNGTDPIKILNKISNEGIEKLKMICNSIDIDIAITPDNIPLLVMKWRWMYFNGNRYYTKDKDNYGSNEYWAPAITTLENKKGDCDDYAILEYCLIREMFKLHFNWSEYQHRLKFAAGNVNNNRGRYVGGHAYLLWLHSDGKWYTIESTHYVPRCISNYGKVPQKYNQCYGTIWFTVNDKYSFAQFDTNVSRNELVV